MRSLDELAANPGPDEAVTAAHPTPTQPAPATRLDGVRLAVKDLVAVAGHPLRAGSLARADAPAEPRDAAIVALLRAAGATVAGIVDLHEIAFGTTGINDQVGFPRNPHDAERIPGGSSSGSAVAVAEGRADLAIGTDTGGSIRIPAALCGVVGFKPSYARYPTDGVLALSPTLDHVGLLAPTVAGIVAAHRALTGEAPTPVRRPGRLGVDRTALVVADAPVAAAVDAALRTLHDAGWELVDVTWPERARIQEVTTAIMFAEAATVHRTLLETHGDKLGADVLARLRVGAAIPAADHRAAAADAVELHAEVTAQLATVDAVVGPTLPVVAPTVAEARADATWPARLVSNTRLANVTGVAALSLPLATNSDGATDGHSRGGLPVGLQVLAASDAQALAVATAIWQPEGA